MDLDEIYFGDSVELIKNIPDKSIDLIVTDPPYMGNYAGGEDASDRALAHAE